MSILSPLLKNLTTLLMSTSSASNWREAILFLKTVRFPLLLRSWGSPFSTIFASSSISSRNWLTYSLFSLT